MERNVHVSRLDFRASKHANAVTARILSVLSKIMGMGMGMAEAMKTSIGLIGQYLVAGTFLLVKKILLSCFKQVNEF